MGLTVNIQKDLGDFQLNMGFECSGGITGLLGPSGCGKSMTLKCIAGIEKPDSGRIVLDGVTLFDSEKGINLPAQQRHVGYLFQNYALFPNMTVRQNILCGLMHEKDSLRKQQRYREMVTLLHLEGLENHKPYQLSGGQAQRTALARILVNSPKLLMLDEPFSALDAHLRLRIEMELKGLLEAYGKQVILVTHSRDEAYRMCSTIGVLTEGRMAAMKPTKVLFANPGSIAAAEITGCKNIIPAVKTGDYEVMIPQWGNLRFKTKQPVDNGLKAVGIRAHYWNPSAPQNRNAVLFEQEMEEPFETIILFRFPGQSMDTDSIWWRIPKEHRPAAMPSELGISPANILLLN